MKIEPSALVIGGNGKTGRRVVQRLSQLGRAVRIGSRSADIPFVWEDQATWEHALENVDRVYITHPDFTQDGVGEQIGAFSRFAVEHGVRRQVFLSGRGDESLHKLVENGVKLSGADWTIVRPAWFSQNFSEGFFVDAVRAGLIALPVGDAGEPFVDVEDVADVVVAALYDEQHVGKIYELSGPRLMSFREVAKELSYASGREIVFQSLSLDEFRISLRKSGLPEEYAGMYADIIEGRFAFLVHGVEEVLGRKPRDFTDYAREAAALGVWSTP